MPSNIVMPHHRILEIQSGGAGSSNWKQLGVLSDISQVRFGALKSTEVEISRAVGRDERDGSLVNIDSWRSGAPLVYSTEIEVADMKLRTILDSLEGKLNLRVRYFAGDGSIMTNYEKIRLLSRAWNKKPMGEFSQDMTNSFDGYDDQKDPQRRMFPFESDGFLEIDPIVRQKISGTVTAFAITDIISVGYKRYAGQIDGENTNNAGDQEFLFITDKDGSFLPHVFWTANKGASWTDNTGTGLTDFAGSGITKCGSLIIISSADATGGGLAYAPFADVKLGTATWVRSTGIAAGTVVNAVRAIDSQTVIACGAAGAVYISTDSGRTFASAGTAVTANALTKIAVAGPDLQWIGGASQTLVRRYKGVMSVVTVGAMSAAINSLAVPNGLYRNQEIFVGGADGKVYAAVDGTGTTPSFAVRYTGATAIDALAFAGNDGDYLLVAETNGSSQSRVLRDHSGGYFNDDVEVLGSYTSPANSTINAIAAANANVYMAVGDVNSSYGYIERAS